MVKYKKIWVAATAISLIFIAAVFAGVLNRKFMDISEAKKRWGHEQFNPEIFKKGDAKTKASMAVSLIEDKRYIGKTRQDVRKELGDFSGHYFSESIPTYIIHEGWQKEGEDTWQLVFLLNRDRVIKEVRIHKNCCER